MKNNLRILSLALCMLPMYLHARTGQDLNPAYQPATASSARSGEPIPSGTTVPVSLNSNLRSDKSISGAAITATVMQDVPLGGGKTLRAGAKVTGHVVEAIAPGKGSDESRISFQFDQIHFGDQTVPVTTSLRALASVTEVDAAQVPASGGEEDYSGDGNLVQIGGAEVSYGLGGPVLLGSQVVGKYTSQGVLANVSPDLGPDCRSMGSDNRLAQAYWLFSASACGAYGFDHVQILHSGGAVPAGEVTLTSNRKALKIGKGSAMLLRVEGSTPEEAQAGMAPSQGMAQ